MYSRSRRYVICDICGFKYRVQDVNKITDPHNRHYGLVVCKRDQDPTNAQDRPFAVHENLLANKDLVRPRHAEVFLTNTHDDRVPGAPTNGSATVNPLNATIDLNWDAPGNNGSSAIIGYIIKRATPQFAFYDTLTSDTGTSATYYADLTGVITSQYSYKVAAFNTYGTGAYSNEFFWPKQIEMLEDMNYLVASQDNSVLTASDTGYYIRVNYTSFGVL